MRCEKRLQGALAAFQGAGGCCGRLRLSEAASYQLTCCTLGGLAGSMRAEGKGREVRVRLTHLGLG